MTRRKVKAVTHIALDGDVKSMIPARKVETLSEVGNKLTVTVEVDEELLKIHKDMVELAQANRDLQTEIEQRIQHQQEKDRLFEVVSQQSEQLRNLTTWLVRHLQMEQTTYQSLLDHARPGPAKGTVTELSALFLAQSKRIALEAHRFQDL